MTISQAPKCLLLLAAVLSLMACASNGGQVQARNDPNTQPKPASPSFGGGY